MCGRYGFGNPARLDALPLGVTFPTLAPRFNAAPTQSLPVVVQDGDGRRVLMARWGLVPSWAEDPSIGNRLINARGDTARTKPSFRSAFKARRALVPADLFYEWQAVPGSKGKQPWCIRMADDGPFVFAGLWERWRPRAEPDADWLETFTLITTEPNALMAPIHDRMPFIVPPAACERWLDPATPPEVAERMIGPFPAEAMRAFRVSTWVNSPAHDDPRCVEPVTGSAA